MTINERFETIIEVLFRGNKRAFAKAVGISPTVVENVVGARQGKPSYDVIEKVCANANISAEWLIMGKGNLVTDMFEIRKPLRLSSKLDDEDETDNNNKDTDITDISDQEEHIAHHTSENSNEGIPLIPLSAMAGAFTGDTSVMEYECERYVIPAFKGADFLIQVKGDSMQPTYYSGDLVACQRVPLNDLFFQWNKTYVLDTAQGPLIKRIRRGSDDEHILIVSDNTEYEPFELSKSQFHGVALVRGLVRLE